MTREQAVTRRKNAVAMLDALKREIAALDFALTGFAPMAWPTGVGLTPKPVIASQHG
jgi:hypothetical protein